MKSAYKLHQTVFRVAAVTTAMVAVPLAALAQQAQGCDTAPCVRKDKLVSADGFPRVSVAAHRPTSLLAVSSQLLSCSSRVAVHASTDDGASWTANCLPPVEFNSYHEAPALAFNEQGALFAASVADAEEMGSYPQMHRSTDGGHTWSELDVGSAGYGREGRANGMRVKVDTSPASPFRGSVYGVLPVSTVEYTEAYVFFTASRDGGDSWSHRAASPYDREVGRVKQADLAIDRKGRLYLSYVQCQSWSPNDCGGSNADLMLSISQDGGATWVSRGKIATISNSYSAPVLVANTTHGLHAGNLYSVRSTLVDGQMRILVSTSTDGGKNWGAELPVHGAGTASQLTPAAVVADDGALAVSWIDRYADQPGAPMQPMVALSSDGGASFSAPLPLITKPRKNDSDFYLNDGNSLAAAGSRLHAAYAVPDKEGDLGVHLGGLKR